MSIWDMFSGSKHETGSKAVNKEIGAMMETGMVEESVTKKAAKEAMSKKFEGPIKLKGMDTKTLAMVEFLNKYPNWAKKFGDISSMDASISAETMNLVASEMESPSLNYYFDEKKHEGFWETVQMKEFREAKDEFMAKFGAKLNTWKAKGLEVNENDLAKAYMKDKSLDLVTTPDNKVAWGTPAAGYEVKL